MPQLMQQSSAPTRDKNSRRIIFVLLFIAVLIFLFWKGMIFAYFGFSSFLIWLWLVLCVIFIISFFLEFGWAFLRLTWFFWLLIAFTFAVLIASMAFGGGPSGGKATSFGIGNLEPGGKAGQTGVAAPNACDEYYDRYNGKTVPIRTADGSASGTANIVVNKAANCYTLVYRFLSFNANLPQNMPETIETTVNGQATTIFPGRYHYSAVLENPEDPTNRVVTSDFSPEYCNKFEMPSLRLDGNWDIASYIASQCGANVAKDKTGVFLIRFGTGMNMDPDVLKLISRQSKFSVVDGGPSYMKAYKIDTEDIINSGRRATSSNLIIGE